jgi:hypothetical protein
MTVQQEQLIEELVRLRRIQQGAAHDRLLELEPTIALITRLAGPTVKRSVAARLLGISQTALDKWVAGDELATVRTPSGRVEIPTGELLALLDEVDRSSGAGRPVAAAIRRRRERSARELGIDLLPWDPHGVPDSHRRADLRSLAYHRAVARTLDEAGVSAARARLDRWRSEGRIDHRWAEEWSDLLSRPFRDVIDAIGADTPHAADLRQSSPFAGALSERDRRDLLRAVDSATT